MKILLNSKKTKNYFVTLAIGKKYFDNWYKFAYPTWKDYCKKHDIGIICFDKHLIDKNHLKWKNPNWQKLLIGEKLKNKKTIKNVCYIDTDFLINPFAPNIFKSYNSNKIAVSSNISKLPYQLNFVKRKVVFYRRKFINKKYPLDSVIFSKTSDMYKFSNLKVFKEDLCSGLFIFNVKKHYKVMNKWFFLYDQKTISHTGGDQVHFSYHLLKYNKIQFLDYKFQAFWIYEMALNYPFLYFIKNKKIIKNCILSCLMNNYFIHFAGRWTEGEMWKMKVLEKEDKKLFKNFFEYLKMKVYGKSKGYISYK
jgi:hypothetical protein